MTFGLYILFTLVILLFFGLWIRRLIVKRLEPGRILADLEGEVQEVIRSLNAAGDQNISLLEDRIEALKTLLRHADTQIEEMESQLTRLRRARDEIDEWEAHPEAYLEPPVEPPLTLPLRKHGTGSDEETAVGADAETAVGFHPEATVGTDTKATANTNTVEMTPRELVLYLHIHGH